MAIADFDETSDPRWRGLYRAGGLAALLTAAFLPLQIAFYIAWPPPSGQDVAAWLVLFDENPLRGLLSLDLIMMVEEVFLVAIVAALYVALHRSSESLMALVAAGWLVAATLFVASNTGFQMLALSRGYAGAASEAERVVFLAAGRTMLTTYWDQGTAFVFGYTISSVAGILVGIAMLRSGLFGRAAACAAIAGNVVGLGIFVPLIGVPLSLLSVLILWVWYAIVGFRLWRLGGTAPAPATLHESAAVAI